MPFPLEALLDPESFGYEFCKWCDGYGTSFHEDDDSCTRCDGSGLVKKGSQNNLGKEDS